MTTRADKQARTITNDGAAHVPADWIRYLLKRLDCAAPPANTARQDRIMALVRRYGSLSALYQKAASEGLRPTSVDVDAAYAALEQEVRKG